MTPYSLLLCLILMGCESAIGQTGDPATNVMIANLHDNIAIMQCRVQLQGFAIQFYEDYALAIRTNQPTRALIVLEGAREIMRRGNDINPGTCKGQNQKDLLQYVTALGRKLKASKP